MTTSEIATVLAWHDALNASDIDTLVALSSDDIDFGDARGAAQGHQALRRWAASLDTTAELGRMFVHDGVVVVEGATPSWLAVPPLTPIAPTILPARMIGMPPSEAIGRA